LPAGNPASGKPSIVANAVLQANCASGRVPRVAWQ